MSQYRDVAQQLTDALELSLPPIAISLAESFPQNLPAFDGVVPAGCAFWQEAAKRTFVTSAPDHELCSIGVHTHKLAGAAESQQAELQDALAAMTGLGYVTEEEVRGLPVMPHESQHVVYGPLADFSLDPDVVLLFADAARGLIISEAAARVDASLPPAMGRPACAVVPQVVNGGVAAQSLGCCGARAYLDVLSDNVALWALPGKKLEEYGKQITVLSDANKILTQFHQHRQTDIAAGQRPTVNDSLQRLS